jgi:preprotein translocase subunit SecF
MDAKHSSDVTESTAVEAPDLESAASELPRHGFFTRLYTGTGGFDVIGRRKMWFTVSGVIIAIAIASILIRGFTFGIDFQGGTTVSFPSGNVTVAQAEEVYRNTLGHDAEQVVIVGSGGSAAVQIRSVTLSNDQTEKLRTALFDAFHPKGTDGQPSKQAISDSAVSSTWGSQITKQGLIALAVFLVLVGLYIMLRYERYMAIAALSSLLFGLTTTAGIYSLVGFEVSPATLIGLLTIMGFSLYDTVIVFDKVQENTKGFEHTTRRTFAEQANLAINQTFMRSINTTLISITPVVSLWVVAVWLLGVGTLKDLALVMLVGVVCGTYSSIFFATPLLVTLRERTELVRTHTRRVVNRRKPAAAKTSESDAAKTSESDAEPEEVAAALASGPAPAEKPAPGARPVRPTSSRTGRPSGKRNTRRR